MSNGFKDVAKYTKTLWSDISLLVQKQEGYAVRDKDTHELDRKFDRHSRCCPWI